MQSIGRLAMYQRRPHQTQELEYFVSCIIIFHFSSATSKETLTKK